MSIRRIASAASTGLFSFLLFMFITTMGIVLVLSNPAKIKAAISQSNFYDTLVSGILTQSQQQTAGQNDLIDTVPLDRPEIQAAIHTTFPPAFLQTQSEKLISSLYPWLQGRESMPDFRIDLTSAKAAFALATGNYIQKRLATLPACSVTTLPASFDAFNTNCVPPGFDTAGEVQQAELQVASSAQFLPIPTLTASSFTGSNSQPLFTQLHQLPDYYQTAVRLPSIFAVLAIIAGGVAVISSLDKRKTIHRLGSILIGTGFFFIFTSWLLNSLFQHFTNSLDSQSGGSFFTQKFNQVFNQADKFINREYLILGALAIVLGGVMWTVVALLPFRFRPTENGTHPLIIR